MTNVTDLMRNYPMEVAQFLLKDEVVISSKFSAKSGVSSSTYLDVFVADQSEEDGERYVSLRVSDHGDKHYEMGRKSFHYTELVKKDRNWVHPDADGPDDDEYLFADPDMNDDAWIAKF